MMIAHFARIAAGSLVLVAVTSAGALLAQRPAVTPRIPQPNPVDAAKPAGKWVVKSGGKEWVLVVAADGAAQYSYPVGDKPHTLRGKFKDGELRLDHGNGTFLIYNAAVRDGKLVLSAGDLKAGQEAAFARADDGPVKPAPPPPAADEKDDPPVAREKGLHAAPRGPRDEPKPPKDGEEPSQKFLRHLIQHGREGNSGGLTYLMEIKSVNYGPARKAAPTETQPFATGSPVYPVSMKWTSKVYGQSGIAACAKETRFICWKTDTGEWRSGHVEEKSGEIESVDK